jgi:hypothetical protein
MQTSFSAGLACPFWLRTGQTHAESVAVVVDLPLAEIQGLDAFRGEVLGCTVRTGDYFDGPVSLWMMRNRHGRGKSKMPVDVSLCRTRIDSQDITLLKLSTRKSTEFAQFESRSTPHNDGDLNTTLNGEIHALPMLDKPDSQDLTSSNGDSLVLRDRFVVDSDWHYGSCDCDDGIAVELERGPLEGTLESSSIWRVADEPICQTKRIRVHGTTGRNTDAPIASTAGIILDCG